MNSANKMLSPLSNTENVKLIRTVNPKNLVDRYKLEFEFDIFEELNLENQLIYHWKCLDTGFQWYTPLKFAGGSKLYEDLSKIKWYYTKNKWEFHKVLSNLKQESQILEIGAGDGYFLQLASQNGHICSGIELNIEKAQELKRKGFNIINKKIEEINKEFDVICLFQVLEHIPEPIFFLRNLIHLVKNGGKIYFACPNSEVMEKVDPFFLNLLNQPPHHMSHWRLESFKYLEKILPISLISVSYERIAKEHVEWMVIGYFRSFFSKNSLNIAKYSLIILLCFRLFF